MFILFLGRSRGYWQFASCEAKGGVLLTSDSDYSKGEPKKKRSSFCLKVLLRTNANDEETKGVLRNQEFRGG